MSSERGPGAKRRKLFSRNRSGPGWHPGSWLGWLIIVVVVLAIVAVVVLFRTGVL
jgi:hypothetical protein